MIGLMEELDRIRDLARQKYNDQKSDKLKIINDMLSNDDVFLLIDMDVAIDILNTLGVDNPIDEYKKLIDINNKEDERIEVV